MSEGRGDPRSGDDQAMELEELDAVLADLRTAFVRPAPPDVAADHLARMEAAALEERLPAAAPALAASGAEPVRHHLRRRLAVVAAGVVAVLFGVGGLGYAGALPGPVQDTVASVMEPFGLDLPRSDDPPATSDREDPSSGAGNGARSDEEPGRSGETPGRSGESPGQSGETPGQSGTTPANGSEPPGQSGESPGQSGSAPGQSGEDPGNSENAPGQGATNPGNTGGNSNGNAGGNSAGGAANGNEDSNAGGNGNANGGNSADAPGQNR
ncbi:MAG TPA: hypothetical protein VIY72_06930 [Acidimicrobiales bacterium]